MSPALERIRNEAKLLSPDEREALLVALDYDLHGDNPPDGSDAEAAWDKEIASRMKEVEEGKVPLLSADEFERDTASFSPGLASSAQSAAHETSHAIPQTVLLPRANR